MSEISESTLSYAQKYTLNGWHLHPINGKIPLLSNWPEKATSNFNTCEKWFLNEYQGMNIGCVTGKKSNITVLDVDAKSGGLRTLKVLEDLRMLPSTLRSKTGGGGFHLFFQYEPRLKTSTNLLPGIDVRNDGGQVVLPPSIHVETQKKYSWYQEVDLKVENIIKMPETIIDLLGAKDPRREKKDGKNVLEGERNSELTSYGGAIWNKGYSDENLKVLLLIKNQEFPSPLEEDEVERVWESVCKMPRKIASSQNKIKSAEEILSVILELEPEYLQSVEGINYVQFIDNETPVTYAIRGKELRDWLTCELWNHYSVSPRQDVIKNVISTLDGLASREGKKVDINTRIAWQEGVIYYDLCNKANQAVKISSEGIEYTSKPNNLLTREYMQEQCLPKLDSDGFKLLSKYLPMEEDQRLLTTIWLITAFISNIPHPILIPFGEKGSGKSTLFRVLREILDPSAAAITPMPSNSEDLFRIASRSYALFIDNVGMITNNTSDLLCCLTTGTELTRRKLYTDDDERLLRIRRVIAMNGVINPSSREDLLDRSLLIELSRLPGDNFIPEKIIWENFSKDKPEILGSIFDVLSKAMYLMESGDVEYPIGFRMADFAHWASAIGRALGGPEGEEKVLSILRNNNLCQNQEALQASPIAMAIPLILKERREWSGTPTDFYKEINEIAEFQLGINTYKNPAWPGDAAWAVKKANSMKAVLRNNGIVFETGKKNGERIIYISWVLGDQTNTPSEEGTTLLEQAETLFGGTST